MADAGLQLIIKEAEGKLVEAATGLYEQRLQYQAAQFRFSKLQEHYRSEYQIKIAVNLIHDLLKSSAGQIFVCMDSDIFVLARGANRAQFDKLIFQLRYLFMDDPLAYHSDGMENEQFCRFFDLAHGWEDFINACKMKVAGLMKTEGQQTATQQKEAAGGYAGKARPFNPTRLASLEKDLISADLSRLVRRQPICASLPNRPVRPVFDELYINIGQLRQMLMSDVDLFSNRWLFQYLTQILDERMLSMLRRRPSSFFEKPTSINLNVASLLSDAFSEFDAVINPATKVSIVIEIQISDVFGDIAAFNVARETVQKLGYRVCVDGLTSQSFTQVDRERLGFDLAKLQWNADLESDIRSPENKKLINAITQCGTGRVILCRCDSRHAIEYGQALGISLFQGRFLDRLVNPDAKHEN